MDDLIKFVDPKTFKEMAAENDTDNVAVRKFIDVVKIEELNSNDEKLQLKFKITTADVDRDNDTIVLEGWDFTDFKKNPVVLWAHSYSTPPVAKAVNIFRDSMSIDSVAEFTPKEMNPFGYMIYQMYKGGFLSAVSVGFQPTDFELARDREGGMNFTRQSLMEYSTVPVPSNPHALIQARSKGINTEPLKEWAENILDDWDETGEGLLIPKNTIEEVRKDSDPKQKMSVAVPDSTEPTKEQLNTDEPSEPSEPGEPANQDKEIKRPIAYAQAHPDGTPSAAKDTDWSGSAQIAAASVEDLAVMCAWVDEENPDTKGAYKLPHHLATDQHSLVWRGLTAAMGALLGARGGVDIPDNERRGVYNHLAKHYAEFDETPPEFRYVEIQILKTLSDDYYFNSDSGQVEKLTQEIKVSQEVKRVSEKLDQLSKEAETDHVHGALLEAINTFKDFKEIDCDCPEHGDDPHDEIPNDSKSDEALFELDGETEPEQDSVSLDDGLDAGAIAEIVEQAVDARLRKFTGRLD